MKSIFVIGGTLTIFCSFGGTLFKLKVLEGHCQLGGILRGVV
jgi:hypothetical protein